MNIVDINICYSSVPIWVMFIEAFYVLVNATIILSKSTKYNIEVHSIVAFHSMITLHT